MPVTIKVTQRGKHDGMPALLLLHNVYLIEATPLQRCRCLHRILHNDPPRSQAFHIHQRFALSTLFRVFTSICRSSHLCAGIVHARMLAEDDLHTKM